MHAAILNLSTLYVGVNWRHRKYSRKTGFVSWTPQKCSEVLLDCRWKDQIGLFRGHIQCTDAKFRCTGVKFTCFDVKFTCFKFKFTVDDVKFVRLDVKFVRSELKFKQLVNRALQRASPPSHVRPQ